MRGRKMSSERHSRSVCGARRSFCASEGRGRKRGYLRRTRRLVLGRPSGVLGAGSGTAPNGGDCAGGDLRSRSGRGLETRARTEPPAVIATILTRPSLV